MPKHAPTPTFAARAFWPTTVACGAVMLAGLIGAAQSVAPAAHSSALPPFPAASEPAAHGDLGGPLEIPSIGALQPVATTAQNVPENATSAPRTARTPRNHVPTTPSVAPRTSQGVSAGPTPEVTSSPTSPPVAPATTATTAAPTPATSQPPTTPSSDSSATDTTTPVPSASDTQPSPEPSPPSSGSTAPESDVIEAVIEWLR